MIKKINGVIKFKRTTISDCVCCEGNHIFSKYINEYGSDEILDVNSEIYSLLTNDKEGKKIKIIIEIEE